MKISVALCTYNGEYYLAEQLESIAKQSRLPDELIICDDGSTDKTHQVVAAFAATCSFSVHIYHNEKNLGSTKNFEKAIGLCQGDIITLSDQDDMWLPDKLKQIEKVFNNNPDVGLVFSDAIIVDDQLNALGKNLWQTIRFNSAQQQSILKGHAVRILLKHPVVTGATMAFRSHFRELVLPIPDSWVHDGWIAFLIAVVSKITLIPTPLLKYRQHAHNQIGASADSLVTQIEEIRSHTPALYKKQCEQYQALNDRLLTLNQNPMIAQSAYHVRQKIDHLQIRGLALEKRNWRIILLIRNLIMLRYHRYSMGFYSFAKDILLSFDS